MVNKILRVNPRLYKIVALIAVALIAFVVLTHTAPRAIAQSGGTYDLTWNSIDSGGATNSTGGTFSLDGTIGQYDAGAGNGGAFALSGGFWGGNTIFNLFLPIILR